MIFTKNRGPAVRDLGLFRNSHEAVENVLARCLQTGV